MKQKIQVHRADSGDDLATDCGRRRRDLIPEKDFTWFGEPKEFLSCVKGWFYDSYELCPVCEAQVKERVDYHEILEDIKNKPLNEIHWEGNRKECEGGSNYWGTHAIAREFLTRWETDPDACPKCLVAAKYIRDQNKKDPINPQHYKTGSIECIDALEASSTQEEFTGYLKLTAMAYLWRERDKGCVEDIEKANWYMDRLLKFSEKTKK